MTLIDLTERRIARLTTIHPLTLIRELQRDILRIERWFMEQEAVWPDQCRQAQHRLQALEEQTHRLLTEYHPLEPFRTHIQLTHRLAREVQPLLASLRRCRATSAQRSELQAHLRERLTCLVEIYPLVCPPPRRF